MAYGAGPKERFIAMNNNNIQVKKSTLYLVGAIVVILIAGFFMLKIGSAAPNGNVINENYNGEVQTAKLSVSGGSYVLSPSSFKKDILIRLEADLQNMPGCSKSIVISAFGVKEVVSSSNNVIEFIPNKAGTFNIACSMNMYKGTFVVLDDYGKESNYIEPENTKAASCSLGGCGGCGR